MKAFTTVIFILFSSSVQSQDLSFNIDPAEMEAFQKGMQGLQQGVQMLEQEMAKCMQGVTEQDMQKIEEYSHKEIDEIKALCAAGNRSKAQSKALVFSKEIKAMPTMKTISKCYRKLESMGIRFPTNEYNDLDKKFEKKHACDIN